MKKKNRRHLEIALGKLESIRIGPYKGDGYRISGVDVIMLGHAETALREVLGETRGRIPPAGIDSPVSIRSGMVGRTTPR